MAQIKSKAIVIAVGVILVGLAVIIGKQAAALIENWNASSTIEEYHAKASDMTAAVLRKMGTIQVGDTLADFVFEDIDGKEHRLSELVTDRSLISYMKPDCDACLEETERLRSVAKGPEDYEHVIMITSANPLHMQRVREDYGLKCVILYDEERQFGSVLKVQTYPFNIVVDRGRVIREIHANGLLTDDYERLFANEVDRPASGYPSP
jgi:peroxiredoxin